MKKIYVYSPQAQTGKTTIANHLGILLSQKALTCLVECNRYGSYSIFLNKKIKETQKSLTNIYNNLEIEDQLIQSSHSDTFFFASKNMTDPLLDLYNINSEEYNKLINYLEEHFEYILIDLPTNYIEKMMIDAIATITNEDYLLIVLDENLQTYKLLKDYDSYFNSILLEISKENIFFLKNKSFGYVSDQAVCQILDSLNLLQSKNALITLPFLKELILYNNEGRAILNSPGSRKEKEYVSKLKHLVDLLEGLEAKKKNTRFFSFRKKKKNKETNKEEYDV